MKYSELLKITLLALLVFIGGVALGNRFAEVLGMGEPLIFGTVNATVIDQQIAKYLKQKILLQQ